ncbi:glycoside hydrolase family 88 protein [Enterococcus sp. BWR-S5]|uniref:glycoside hydrolase family 88 protein n=1 Tax=Enterococcus sp. BWR-S5 TaxID=2787714 RepID=UPI001920F12A|nr:glycoside hydrolase family 88 protein [Enterococcus sp. BWR-S5]MBL1226994.1 glycoside hydrolase family 88 protein [Enterococcus sp. BWR-S5]
MEKIDEYLDRITAKVLSECARNEGSIPYIPENGRYTDMGQEDIAWWTNGFFGGVLWQLYHYTGKEELKAHAEQIETKLDQALEEFIDLHHDVGFMWLHTAVANYRKTGNEQSKVRGLKAAAVLASRFNSNGQFIRAWNEDKTGWIIIDSMMNIPLLHWATTELDDPRFKQLAIAHADTVQQYLIRKDGSSAHIGSFNPENGEFIEWIGGQGYSSDSAWSRGQGWAIYGFVLSYKHTGDIDYLNTAIRVANYFLASSSQTAYVPAIDFKAPVIEEDTDTSAAMIAACGLIELSQTLPKEQGKVYKKGAVRMLTAVLEAYTDFSTETDGLVRGGAVDYHSKEGKNVGLVYADYFLIEALLKLKEAEMDLW